MTGFPKEGMKGPEEEKGGSSGERTDQAGQGSDYIANSLVFILIKSICSGLRYSFLMISAVVAVG